MTVLSWFLECFTGVITIAINIHSENPDSNVDLIFSVTVIDAFLNFVLIPGSYLLNNEINKKLIIAEGWCKIFRKRVQSNKIRPSANEAERIEMAPYPRRRHVGGNSVNIQDLQVQHRDITNQNLDKDLLMITAHNLFCNPWN